MFKQLRRVNEQMKQEKHHRKLSTIKDLIKLSQELVEYRKNPEQNKDFIYMNETRITYITDEMLNWWK